MPKVGESLQLNVQLFDGAENKYPRATLYDADGSELAASPVDLSHVGSGLYTDDSVGMPSTEAVRAVYVIYDDAGHTTESSLHARSMDVFALEFGAAGLAELEGQIAQDDSLIGEIDADGEIVGQIEC
jgi:hypothetical protein